MEHTVKSAIIFIATIQRETSYRDRQINNAYQRYITAGAKQ